MTLAHSVTFGNALQTLGNLTPECLSIHQPMENCGHKKRFPLRASLTSVGASIPPGVGPCPAPLHRAMQQATKKASENPNKNQQFVLRIQLESEETGNQHFVDLLGKSSHQDLFS